MQCMVLNGPGQPLRMEQRPSPTPAPGQVLVQISHCAVCRTDLHLMDGELPDIPYPVVPGHEIVGRVIEAGSGASLAPGERVGIPWLGHTCGHCEYCDENRENLCDRAQFTGYQIDGGFATHTLADARFCFPLPDTLDDAHAAPLLCAGLIGFRSLRMAGEAKTLGIYGFGAAAHLICQVAVWQKRQVFAFTRPGDTQAQAFAREMGAEWAGDSNQPPPPPRPLDAAIIFAPAGELVPAALKSVKKGGTVVCGGIHMSEIPAFPYRILWGERVLRSVANLTRADAREFLQLAAQVPLRTEITCFELSQANEALERLRSGAINGAAVLRCQAS